MNTKSFKPFNPFQWPIYNTSNTRCLASRGIQQHPIKSQMTHFQRVKNYNSCQHTNTSINKPHAQKISSIWKKTHFLKTVAFFFGCFIFLLHLFLKVYLFILVQGMLGFMFHAFLCSHNSQIFTWQGSSDSQSFNDSWKETFRNISNYCKTRARSSKHVFQHLLAHTTDLFHQTS